MMHAFRTIRDGAAEATRRRAKDGGGVKQRDEAKRLRLNDASPGESARWHG